MKAKKILAFVMAIAMVLSSMNITALATTGTVAQIGDKEYSSFEAAWAATKSGDTINLLGNTVTLSGAQNTVNGDITITNGTLDITDAYCSANSIFYLGDATDVLTLDGVTVQGDGYSSAYGVIYAEKGTVNIKKCTIALKNEQATTGGVLKGNAYADSNFVISDSTFNLENTCRVMAMTTVDMDNVTIDARITDDTLGAGELNNHAFRKVYGTITNSTISVDGFETGIKNDDTATLRVDGTSSVTLENSVVCDLYLGSSDTKLFIEDTAKVYATTTSVVDDAVTGEITNEKGWYNDTDTTFTITNKDQLFGFAKLVNKGNDFSGKTVILGADIDLKNEEWTPIGGSTNGKSFKGTFDGGYHTIKNLKITKSHDNTAENNRIGFFGRTDSPASIFNLTIENVDITGSLYVGAIVGHGYTGKKIENCTVKGLIKIDAWWYAGVIGGNGYMNLVNNCHVIGDVGSYIKGNDGSYIGGIWGFRGEGGQEITNCSVSNLAISGVDRLGGIAGIAHYENSISDCTITNVTIEASNDGVRNVALIAGANLGQSGSPAYVINNTVENSIAKVGDTEITTHVGTGNHQSETECVCSVVGTSVTFDENGLITGGTFEGKVDASLVAEGYQFNADGTVTAVVSSPTGTLSKAYTSADTYWGECGGNASESFEFKVYHDDTYMGYTSLNDVDNIIDGDVYVSWHIKLDAESNTDEYWDMAWEIAPTVAMQPNRVEQWVDGVKVAECAIEPNWSDSIFPVVAAVTDDNEKILSYVNNLADDTLENAVAAGGNVVLLKDITLSETLTIPADVTTTLDLAGKTISQVKAQTGSYQMILNDGSLTINDSVGGGKISYTDSGNGGEYISDTIYNRGTLEINGGTIENLSSETVATNGYPHAVDTYSGIRDTSVTINGGTIYCASYSAIRMFCVSAKYKADLVINGGTIKGAVDMQNGTKDSANGTLTINGATFEKTASKANVRFANWNGGATEYGITASIEGGTFDGGINTAYVPATSNWNSKIISGGTFGVDVSDYCEDGFECKVNSDGTYGVVEEESSIFGRTFFIRNMVKDEATGNYRVGFFGGIDSLNYKEVGFKFMYSDDEEIASFKTSDVYTSVTVINNNGNTKKYTPDMLGSNTNYIFGKVIQFDSTWDGIPFLYRAFAVDMDGNYIYDKYCYEIDDIYTLKEGLNENEE